VITLRVFTLNVMISSLEEVPVSTATTTELTPGLAVRSEAKEAKTWIERQLRWERTLGTLRNERSETREQRAA
jgi:hypothetical protein